MNDGSQDSSRRGRVAALVIGLPLLLGLGFAALAHFAGHAPSQGETAGAVSNPGLTPAANRVAAGTSAPRVRLEDGQTGAAFDSAALRGQAYAVVFVSTRCARVGEELRAVVKDLDRAGVKDPVLGISADPAADTRGNVRAWLRQHQEPPGFHYLTGSERQLKRYWRAWGLSAATAAQPASLCAEEEVPVHLVAADGTNAGVVDLGPEAPASLVAEAIEGIPKK
jgi:cytochrome oxidase Cu insertion factor (SCO1/SenC/PrrC family)